MTTKEMERKALEKIRKIVADLGEDSYIGMAFEGCFEIAEENIENDFGCSMKQRAEAAEKKVSTLELDNRDLRLAIKKSKEDASRTQTELEERIRKLEGFANAIRADDLVDFIQMLDDEIFTCNENMKSAAETIVQMADTPNDIAFINAVKIHRAAQSKKKYLEDMAARVQAARSFYNA